MAQSNYLSKRIFSSDAFTMRLFAAVFLIFVLLCSYTRAQYRFDSWTTDNGLPQVSVNSILQTRDGFLWLTTFGGDYDGMEIFLYDMAGELYALVTSAEGVLARPVLVKTVTKRSKDLTLHGFTFTLPGDNGGRKFTGKYGKSGITLTESETSLVLKDKCYK